MIWETAGAVVWLGVGCYLWWPRDTDFAVQPTEEHTVTEENTNAIPEATQEPVVEVKPETAPAVAIMAAPAPTIAVTQPTLADIQLAAATALAKIQTISDKLIGGGNNVAEAPLPAHHLGIMAVLMADMHAVLARIEKAL